MNNYNPHLCQANKIIWRKLTIIQHIATQSNNPIGHILLEDETLDPYLENDCIPQPEARQFLDEILIGLCEHCAFPPKEKTIYG